MIYKQHYYLPQDLLFAANESDMFLVNIYYLLVIDFVGVVYVFLTQPRWVLEQWFMFKSLRSLCRASLPQFSFYVFRGNTCFCEHAFSLCKNIFVHKIPETSKKMHRTFKRKSFVFETCIPGHLGPWVLIKYSTWTLVTNSDFAEKDFFDFSCCPRFQY